jgi:hypothetical protein
MAAVDTPYDQKLSWNPSGKAPTVATAVHGTYHVTGTGPTHDVFYRSNRDQPDQSRKLASGISGDDAYQLCVDHNKETLQIIGPVNPRELGRNERTSPECGCVHAGEC